MSEFKEEVQKRRTFAIISHPDAGKNNINRKVPSLWRSDSGSRNGQREKSNLNMRSVTGWKLKNKEGFQSHPLYYNLIMMGSVLISWIHQGHQDFSEDTYRTLMAADSAVMVIDGSKGVEDQTRKLFKVCAMRHIPIFTFINKMDREAKDPYELMDEIERELGVETWCR